MNLNYSCWLSRFLIEVVATFFLGENVQRASVMEHKQILNGIKLTFRVHKLLNCTPMKSRWSFEADNFSNLYVHICRQRNSNESIESILKLSLITHYIIPCLHVIFRKLIISKLNFNHFLRYSILFSQLYTANSIVIEYSEYHFLCYSLTITASCPMNLQYFPMDRQLCHIEIESCK